MLGFCSLRSVVIVSDGSKTHYHPQFSRLAPFFYLLAREFVHYRASPKPDPGTGCRIVFNVEQMSKVGQTGITETDPF